MSKKIDVDFKSIDEIIANMERFYQVPDFQREYKWGEKELKKLIDDIFDAYMQKVEEYFCGSIIIAKNEERYDIIDGQQRLTTFIILACVFRDVYKEKLKSNATRRIEASIQDADYETKKRLKILVSSDKRNDFEFDVLNGINFKEKPKNNNYSKNAFILRKLLKEKEDEYKNDNKDSLNIDNFVNYVFTNVKLVVIECNSTIDSIQIFNVINDSGIKLNFTEIIKSTLIHKLGENKEDRETFVNEYRAIDNIINSIKVKIKKENEKSEFEYFFGVFAYYELGKKAGEKLGKVLLDNLESKLNSEPNKERNKNAIILKWTKEIKDFAESYRNIFNRKDRNIHLLRYLRHTLHWQSVIATAEFCKYKDIELLKKYLMAWYYQNWIADGTATRLQSANYKITQSIKDDEDIDSIKAIIRNNLNDFNTTSLYKENLQKSNIGNDSKTQWCMPILALIEYVATDERNPNFIDVFNTDKNEKDKDSKNIQAIHLEHILPQKPDKECNEHFNKEEQKQYLRSLGNLTLIYDTSNWKASNKPFNEKIKIYQQSRYAITKNVAKYAAWNAINVKDRRNKMIEIINKEIDIF